MIICGDCLVEMPKLPADSIDAIVTDPPYGLGFMGKDWDHGIPGVHFWQEALRVAKPGCHLLAFGGTRTFHRLTCAIEDAGWEIRDCLGFLYGSGFPKSHRPSLDYERALCEKRDNKWFYKSDSEPMRQQPPFRSDEANEYEGWGTALKPAWEPIIMARKPLDGTVAANVLKWGTGAINVDGCRVGIDPAVDDMLSEVVRKPRESQTWEQGSGFKNEANPRTGVPSKGRWPANLIRDGSDEVLELFPSKYKKHAMDDDFGDWHVFGNPTAARFFYCAKASRKEREMGCEGMEETVFQSRCGGAMPVDDTGKDRDRFKVKAKNHHPTVKPLALMRYLCRLATPPGGLILDPFMGSGTTGIAAKQEGFRFVGIEVSEEYCEIAKKRIYGTLGG